MGEETMASRPKKEEEEVQKMDIVPERTASRYIIHLF
jgi:hypothetical protein